MSDLGGILGEDPADAPAGGRRRGRRSRRKGPGCLIALVVLAALVGGGYLAVTRGVSAIKDQFQSAPDYAGPGTGSVSFQVKTGDTASDIGRGLKEADVVESVDAFIDAAQGNPDSSKIQAGYYQLKKQMRASDALSVLVDPANIVTVKVTIPEGLRVVDIVDLLVKATGFPKSQFDKALKDPSLGLPDYAAGNPEGYLFPATYSFGPKEKAFDMLHDMVVRWQQAATDDNLEAGAQALGYTPGQVMTMASLVEAEGRGQYRTKIARVLYNRLENPDNGVTNGLLQVDASVNYALNRTGSTVITDADKESVADSPYNLYSQPGLPPTPIEAPGDDAIKAALAPAKGDWLFYVTVNLKTGLTKFTADYDQFLTFKNEYENYCRTQSDRC